MKSGDFIPGDGEFSSRDSEFYPGDGIFLNLGILIPGIGIFFKSGDSFTGNRGFCPNPVIFAKNLVFLGLVDLACRTGWRKFLF